MKDLVKTNNQPKQFSNFYSNGIVSNKLCKQTARLPLKKAQRLFLRDLKKNKTSASWHFLFSTRCSFDNMYLKCLFC